MALQVIAMKPSFQNQGASTSKKKAYPGHGLFLEIAGGFDGEDGADIMDPLEYHGIRIQRRRKRPNIRK